MSESYSNHAAPGSADGIAQAHELIARLVPGADAELLVTALLAEASLSAMSPASDRLTGDDGDDDPPARELRRVRRQLALGDAARSTQHDLNNPLTALLAEAQLLELESVAPEQRAAARRIVELARRVAAIGRRLDPRQG